MTRAPQIADWVMLLVLTALWGSAFLFNAIALQSFPPAVLVAARIGIATLALLVVMHAQGFRLPRKLSDWLPMIFLAVFANVLPFHLIAWAQQYIESSLAGVVMAVMPLFVLTLAHFYIPGARLTRYRVMGFVIGFAGVVCVIGPEVLGGLTDNRALWGTLATLAAAFSYSVSSVYARRVDAANPLQLSVGMLFAASMFSLPLASVDVVSITAPTPMAILALAFLGLMSTGVATLIYFRLVRGPGPTFISFVNYLVPGWAVVAGALFLGESLSYWAHFGLVFILLGIAFSEFAPRLMEGLRVRWRRRRSATRLARQDA